jgi:hypothetical protein
VDVHYCQVCDDCPVMEPADGGVAICPVCGSVDRAATRQPLLVVAGASGSGKTAVFPHLAARLSAECLVFDADWLIDPLGGDVRTLEWSVLRDIWLHVAHGIAQNGRPTMLLGSFVPGQLEALPGRRWIGDIWWLLLDCDDDERRRRIDARPAGRTHDIEPQIEFGRRLRAEIPTTVDTTTGSPAGAAEHIARWARDVLRRPATT